MNNKKTKWKSLNPQTLYQNQIEIAKLRDWPVVILTAVITIIILTVSTYLITINTSLTVHEKKVLFGTKIKILQNPSFFIASLWALGMFFSSSVQLFFYIINTIEKKKYKILGTIGVIYLFSLILVFNFDYKHLNIISHDFTLFVLVLFLYFLIYIWSVSMVVFLELIHFVFTKFIKIFTKKSLK
ncbi:hypothetical protein [Leuconostoc citreum]|uniref:hypothetical protein n=1 Tax=Leuconostoc citreum TaxID=33964 RepID=UPI0021A4363C|nr:hypothetical protein [Leuconostoc citreum]MCT3077182.1 hypothetical protein [Leuconostoc citreum]